jgi:hypothetical protein
MEMESVSPRKMGRSSINQIRCEDAFAAPAARMLMDNQADTAEKTRRPMPPVAAAVCDVSGRLRLQQRKRSETLPVGRVLADPLKQMPGASAAAQTGERLSCNAP